MDKLIITATADAENHVIVDITGAKDAAYIRERMFAKVRHFPSHFLAFLSHYVSRSTAAHSGRGTWPLLNLPN